MGPAFSPWEKETENYRCATLKTAAEIRDELVALNLGPGCRPGDIVSLETTGRPHDFVILHRRWVISSAGQQLEITLDHPARIDPLILPRLRAGPSFSPGRRKQEITALPL